tara:strand:- start:2756 stop:2932 length:177 start_codon:yes stop_codon:yes gene_type:complete
VSDQEPRNKSFFAEDTFDQIDGLEMLLDWLKKSPTKLEITSMQNNRLHVKFYVQERKK